MAKFFKELKLEDTVTSIDFSPSGDLFAVGLLDERVIVWSTNYDELNEKKPLMTFENHNMGVIDLQFNPQGNRLAVSSMDSVIKIWNVEEKNLVSEIQCKPMDNWKLAFNPDGKEILTAGELGKIQGFDIEEKEVLTKLASADIFATAIAYSTNGRFLAVGNNVGHLYIYDMKEDKKMQKIEDVHHKQIRDIAFTADNNKIVTVADDFTIVIFDLVKFQKITSLSGHKGNINCVNAHPKDKSKIVTGSYDRTVKVWDIESKTCTQTITLASNVWSVKFSHDGSLVGAATDSGVVALYKV